VCDWVRMAEKDRSLCSIMCSRFPLLQFFYLCDNISLSVNVGTRENYFCESVEESAKKELDSKLAKTRKVSAGGKTTVSFSADSSVLFYTYIFICGQCGFREIVRASCLLMYL